MLTRRRFELADPIVISQGQVVRFPVPSGHPLEQYQRLEPLAASAPHELPIGQALVAAQPTLSGQQLTEHVQNYIDSLPTAMMEVGHLVIDLGDLLVNEGSTVVIAGPSTTFTARNVTVKGTLEVNGSMTLKCEQLGG